jgi:hypothetical protein
MVIRGLDVGLDEPNKLNLLINQLEVKDYLTFTEFG